MLPAVNYHVDTLCGMLAVIFLHTSLNSWHLNGCFETNTISFIYLSGSSSGQISNTSFMIVALHMNVLIHEL
jgi:hypothetical protein